ncbi:hypothetical protein CRG98_010850, partial [Punica granatum]
ASGTVAGQEEKEFLRWVSRDYAEPIKCEREASEKDKLAEESKMAAVRDSSQIRGEVPYYALNRYAVSSSQLEKKQNLWRI